MPTQFRFAFQHPDDAEFFRPVAQALQDSQCWSAIARLMTIISVWEAIMRLPGVRVAYSQTRHQVGLRPVKPDPSTPSGPRSGRGR